MFESILASMSSFLIYLVTDPTAYFALLVWELVWKGLALWYAGSQRQKFWFVIILVSNTLGILPILYLAFFSKKAFVRKINLPEIKRLKAKRPSRRTTSGKPKRKR